MANRDAEFLRIIKSNFSEVEIGSFPELVQPRQVDSEDNSDEEERAERIYHASQDPGIADCLLFGDVEVDELLVRLQYDYDLTEREARELIDDIGYQTGDLADYGDEA